jgi:hypothetical protein
MKEQFGKYCLDVSKLVLGGCVISAIMRNDFPMQSIVFWGTMTVSVIATVGFLFIKYKK